MANVRKILDDFIKTYNEVNKDKLMYYFRDSKLIVEMNNYPIYTSSVDSSESDNIEKFIELMMTFGVTELSTYSL